MTSVALLSTMGEPKSTLTTDPSSIESKLEKLNLKLLQNKLFQSNRTYFLRMGPHVSYSARHSSPSWSRTETGLNTVQGTDETSDEKTTCTSSSSSSNSSSSSSDRKKAKKEVRFADSLGLQLVTIWCVGHSQPVKLRRLTSDEDSEDSSSFDDEDLPSSNDEDDFNCARFDNSFLVDNSPFGLISTCSLPSSSSDQERESTWGDIKRTNTPDTFICDNLVFTWRCLFEQPGILPDFYARLNATKVLLESIYSTNMRLNGIVRVLNLSFVKRIFIRYTLNNWQSFEDLICEHLTSTGSEQDKLTDRFVFSVCLDKSQVISCIDHMKQLKLEFAVCFQVGDDQTSYWDNNCGQNYQYDCTFKIATTSSPSI